MEKKQRNFDRTITEWETKVTGLQADLELSQKEARGYSADVFRYRAQVDDAESSVESLRRENKNLSGKYICG